MSENTPKKSSLISMDVATRKREELKRVFQARAGGMCGTGQGRAPENHPATERRRVGAAVGGVDSRLETARTADCVSSPHAGE